MGGDRSLYQVYGSLNGVQLLFTVCIDGVIPILLSGDNLGVVFGGHLSVEKMHRRQRVSFGNYRTTCKNCELFIDKHL